MKKENKEMSHNLDIASQIKHEAEITRQHARYKIPAKIEIDGKEYDVDNWSISGCAIINLPEEYIHKFTQGKMKFKFDNFETAVDKLKLEFLKNDKFDDHTIMRCRFTELKPDQRAILQHIIDSFLEGSVVTQDDILHVVQHQITYPDKKTKEISHKKAWSILLLIYFVIFILILFLGYVFYNRTFIVKAVVGYVDTNVSMVRSPAPSFIQFLEKIKSGDEINASKPFAVAKMLNGGIRTLRATVNGKVLNVYIHNNEFRNTGEPILSIIPNNAKIYIVAHILSKQAEKLKIGDIATVTLPNGKEFRAKIVNIKYPAPLSSEKSKGVTNTYANSINYVKVILIPIKFKLTPKQLYESVNVKVDTFRQ
ncbi:HlyD family efflux transporter periplasmic adaptor subunit [Methanothermococcus sp.]|uniref:HlyD family efflux transporter periplasmic adaptor subunit n=1 Tax=Methanothermococcus sp. TaxID=2614238 RepID=UPI0025EEE33A|nr:HlyD family efflux transporter periplasmic adaptor subunit [Methanothermococcus sp.]